MTCLLDGILPQTRLAKLMNSISVLMVSLKLFVLSLEHDLQLLKENLQLRVHRGPEKPLEGLEHLHGFARFAKAM